MTVVSRLFNGSVFNFASTPVAGIVGLSYKKGGTWVDVTIPTDANKLFELSTQPDFEIALKFKGHCLLTLGDKGVASITWMDGATDTLPGTWQVGPMNPDGNWDASITDSCTLRPTVPDAS